MILYVCVYGGKKQAGIHKSQFSSSSLLPFVADSLSGRGTSHSFSRNQELQHTYTDAWLTLQLKI